VSKLEDGPVAYQDNLRAVGEGLGGIEHLCYFDGFLAVARIADRTASQHKI